MVVLKATGRRFFGGVFLAELRSGPGRSSVAGNINTSGSVTGTQLVSTVGAGTASLAETSSTLVLSLNADLLDGLHASNFATLGANIFLISSGLQACARPWERAWTWRASCRSCISAASLFPVISR